MKFLKYFLSFFGTITTAIVFIINIHFLTADEIGFVKYIMLQILAAGFATSLVTAAFFSLADRLSRKLIFVGAIVHFIAMCVIMVCLSVWFGWWYDFCLEGVIDMVLSVAIVYVLVFATSYILMKKEADEINRALEERNKERE